MLIAEGANSQRMETISNDVVLYNTEDVSTKIKPHLTDGTVWSSQMEKVELFQRTKNNISLHTISIFEEDEIEEEATVKDNLTVQKEGDWEVQRSISMFNLDVILAIGY